MNSPLNTPPAQAPRRPSWAAADPLAAHVLSHTRSIFELATYDHTAPAFAQIAADQNTSHVGLVSGVLRIRRNWAGVWLFKALCPFCGASHGHAGGNDPLPSFGSRVADCPKGGTYTLTTQGAEHA